MLRLIVTFLITAILCYVLLLFLQAGSGFNWIISLGAGIASAFASWLTTRKQSKPPKEQHAS